jgi:probable HAF family extracellular repeat protein
MEARMKRLSILALILSACFVSFAWAQQSAGAPRFGKHPFPRHRTMNGRLKAPGTAGNRGLAVSATAAAKLKAWDLGHYPGGTWADLGDINDFGVAVGMGDLPDGSTHTLAVPLLGPKALKWIDLGTLGGTASGWDEAINSSSDTGVIVGHSPITDGDRAHGFVWTEKSGMVDLGTLADIGYPTYNSSFASGVNKLGTLIVGFSGVEASCLGCAPTLPVVWTSSIVWKNGVLETRWKINILDTTGLDEMTNWYPWNVNDFGQIVGECSNSEGGFAGVLWTPLPHGKGWKLTRLPSVPDYPESEPFNINDRGEITGDIEPADFSVWIPAYWKPLDPLRKTYSQPIVLALPEGYSGGYADGINEFGDMTGECWGDAGDRAVLWTTKDPTFSQVIGSPTDAWSRSFRVNNFRIAVLSYGDENCASCGRAVQLR